MKKGVFLIGAILTIGFSLSGCGSSSGKSTSSNSKESTSYISKKYKKKAHVSIDVSHESTNNVSQAKNASDSSITSSTSTANTQSSSHESTLTITTNASSQSQESSLISTASTAETKLSQYLNLENNTDITFNDYGGILNSDTNGKFYEITLISKSAQKAGGTGTAGTYKVYQNGEIVSLN